ncbi:family A G protein-coupled receptor-like protein [Microthyrium microscopicum]|uniref:Family A G protein-coupled receptor-like protein n=1 Tax=Microthyrium microscopicum TaxID=703497 RepID=A0A6A6UTA6_9PEZI|nr:family A G protein-coupled receptor-like protein [Microthyrium microscopicum]
MGNHALDVNPPFGADIHITTRGSDWLWTVFSLFTLATILFLAHSFVKLPSERLFHYIDISILLLASITYFTYASDLGYVGIGVEFFRSNHKVRGATRQIFYVHHIYWVLSTPLLLLNVLLTAALPWTHVFFVILVSLVATVSFLVGALISSTYKWGFFVFGLAALGYIAYTLVIPGRKHAAFLGTDVARAYNVAALLLIFAGFLYPIAWGVSEGGNVISPDSEAVFYGILDLLVAFGVCGWTIWAHHDIDPSRLNLRLRSYDEDIPGAKGHVEKPRPAANV